MRPSNDGNKWEYVPSPEDKDDDVFKPRKKKKLNADDSRDENLLGADDDDDEDDGDPSIPPIMRYIHKLKAHKGNIAMMMKNLPPESNANLIVVPMNKHGDGYLVSSYDGRFLKGKMSKAEFQHITTEISRITAHAYSENRIVDQGKVPRKLVWMLVFSYIISSVVLILSFVAVSITQTRLKADGVFMGIMIALLCIGAGIAMSVMFMNYFAKDKHLPTYKERLQFYLQNYFDEINAAVFRRRGLFWKLGNNCKWIELHIVRLDGLQSLLLQKLDEKSNELFSPDNKTP